MSVAWEKRPVWLVGLDLGTLMTIIELAEQMMFRFGTRLVPSLAIPHYGILYINDCMFLVVILI
jgi:hypothetical protein